MGQTIEINFLSFDVEAHSSCGYVPILCNCQLRKINKLVFFSYDSLTIYDGGSSTSPMMGKYCGDSIPPSHVSSSNEILVHFQSDGSVTYSGFKMEYNPLGNTSI